MRKKITTLFLTLLILVGMSISVSAGQAIKIIFDGKELNLPTSAVIENGTTLVPLRAVFEAFGADVKWNDSDKSITATKENTNIWLQINNNAAKVGEENKTLAVPAKIVNGNALVPLRFVSEAFGVSPIWDGATAKIHIMTKKEYGKLYFDDGKLKYEGELVNNIPNGKGQLIDYNGRIYYEGEIVDGKMTGKGKHYFPTGDIYEGTFSNDGYYGRATFYRTDGSVYKGEWVNGKFVRDNEKNDNYVSTQQVTSNDSDINKVISNPWIQTKDGTVYMTVGDAFKKHFNSTDWSKFTDTYGNKLVRFKGQAETAWGDQMVSVEFYMSYDGDLVYFIMNGQAQETLMGQMMIKKFHEEDVEEWARNRN